LLAAFPLKFNFVYSNVDYCSRITIDEHLDALNREGFELEVAGFNGPNSAPQIGLLLSPDNREVVSYEAI